MIEQLNSDDPCFLLSINLAPTGPGFVVVADCDELYVVELVRTLFHDLELKYIKKVVKVKDSQLVSGFTRETRNRLKPDLAS